MTNQKIEKRVLITYMAHDRVSGNCYFGSTFQTLEKRKRQHEYKAARQITKNQFLIDLKSRPEKFFWLELKREIFKIDESFTEKETIKSRIFEKELLEKFIQEPWCYNKTKNAQGFHIGELNPNHTQEWKDLMSKRLSGKNNPMASGHKPETILKISNSLKGKPKPQSMKDKLSGPSNFAYGKQPWEMPTCKNKDVWINADILYQYWIKNGGKISINKFKKQFPHIGNTPSSYQTLVKWFRSGWIPENDNKWLKFVKDIV